MAAFAEPVAVPLDAVPLAATLLDVAAPATLAVLPLAVEPVAELPVAELPVAAAASGLLFPVNEVVRVQEHELLKYAEETITGLSEATDKMDAPKLICGSFVPEEADGDVGLDEVTTTDAM